MLSGLLQGYLFTALARVPTPAQMQYRQQFCKLGCIHPARSYSYLEDDPSNISFFQVLHASLRVLQSRLQLHFVHLGQSIVKVRNSHDMQYQTKLVSCPPRTPLAFALAPPLRMAEKNYSNEQLEECNGSDEE